MGQGVSSEEYQDNLESAWTLEPGSSAKKNGLRDARTGQRGTSFLDDQQLLALGRASGREAAETAAAIRRRHNSLDADEVLTHTSFRGSIRGLHGAQTNFPVQYVTSVVISERVSQLTPQASMQKVKDLLGSGTFTVHRSVLSISSHNVTIKDGGTSNAVNTFPLSSVAMVQVIPGRTGKKLFIFYTEEEEGGKKTKLHIFQSDRTPVETIAAKLGSAVHQYSKAVQQKGSPRRNQKPSEAAVAAGLHKNWVLEPRPHESPRSARNSPAHPVSMETSRVAASQHTGSQLSLNSSVATSGGSPIQHRFQQRQQQNGTVKSTSPRVGGAEEDMKRTLKAARIQRDVDVLNHTFEDLEAFLKDVRLRLDAYREYEEKKKNAKKHDATVEKLLKKAQPPGEAAFVVAYQKCKFAVNLAAKLGHHLSHPSASKILKSLFNLLEELIGCNKGNQLAASVVSPLLSKRAIGFISRSLSQRHQKLWMDLGPNWRTTIDRWPPSRILPIYHVEFEDGCTDTQLHNLSDRPANFPTLDPLSPNERGPDYSDAYDEGYQGDLDDFLPSQLKKSLSINPAVRAAISSTAAMVQQGPIPKPLQTTKSEKLTESEAKKQVPAFITINRTESSCEGEGPRTDSPRPPVHKPTPTTVDGNHIMYHGRLVPAPPSMPAPPPPVHEVEDEPVVDIAPPSLSPSLRWRSAKQMGLPVPTHLPHPLGDVPEDDIIDGALHPLAASFPSAANQMLPPIPIPTWSPAIQELRQSARNRYRKASAPPTFPSNPYGDLLPLPTAPPTGNPPAPPTGTPPVPPTSNAPPPHAVQATKPSAPPPAASVAPLPPAGTPPSDPAPPPAPSAAPAAPPPPPPPPGDLKSIHTQIAENKILTASGATTTAAAAARKVSAMTDDIVAALKSRPPLRRVTVDHSASGQEVFQNELQLKLKQRKNSTSVIQEEEEEGENTKPTVGPVLPFDADEEHVASWLSTYGYQNCVAKLGDISAVELYRMTREQLKEIVGLGSSARLYSQLQRDRAKAESMVSKDFREVMKRQKTRAEMAQDVVAKWKKSTLGAPSGQARPGVAPKALKPVKEVVVEEEEEEEEDRSARRRHRRDEQERKEEPRRHRRRDREERVRRAGSADEVDGSRKKGRGRDKERSRRQGYSDDEDDHKKRRRRKHSKERRRGRHNDSGSEDRKRQRRRRDRSSSESYSNSSSESESESDPRSKGRWALGEGDTMVLLGKPEEQIQQQQAQLQKHMAQLQQIQKQLRIKSLPAEKQQLLQHDLLELQRIQMARQKAPDTESLQLQLIRQQQSLQEHLIELQQELLMMALTAKERGLLPSPSPSPSPPPIPTSISTSVLSKVASGSSIIKPSLPGSPPPNPLLPVAAAPNPLLPVAAAPNPLLPVAAAPNPLLSTVVPPNPSLTLRRDAELAALKAQLQTQQAAQAELLAQNQQQAHVIVQQQGHIQVQAQSQAELLSKSQMQEYLLSQQLAQAESYSQQKTQLEQMLMQQKQETELLSQQLAQAESYSQQKTQLEQMLMQQKQETELLQQQLLTQSQQQKQETELLQQQLLTQSQHQFAGSVSQSQLGSQFHQMHNAQMGGAMQAPYVQGYVVQQPAPVPPPGAIAAAHDTYAHWP